MSDQKSLHLFPALLSLSKAALSIHFLCCCLNWVTSEWYCVYTHSCVVLCNKLVSLNSMRTKTCRLLLYSWYLEQCLKCVKYLVVNIFKTVFLFYKCFVCMYTYMCTTLLLCSCRGREEGKFPRIGVTGSRCWEPNPGALQVFLTSEPSLQPKHLVFINWYTVESVPYIL